MSLPTLALLAASFLTFTPGWIPTDGRQAPTTSTSAASAQDPGASEVAPLLRRVRLIGASVTAGFGTAAEGGLRRNIPLETFLQCALAPKNAGADLESKGSNTFFQSPTLTGRRQVTWAVQSDPTLVVGLDFLFWYGFGLDTESEPRRMAGLEKGLKELEAIDCPLIIGTLPNVNHSMKGKGFMGRPMLSWPQIASDESRHKMNARILDWAADRKNVMVIDSAANLAAFVAGEELKLGEESWKPDSLTSVLQKDLLHLSVDGYVWTALTVTDALARIKGASSADFKQGRKAVREAFDQYVEGELAKRASRREKSARKAGD